RATQQCVAAGVEFYSTAFSSQALFSNAFRGYQLGFLRCRLPCRWRRIIEIPLTLARLYRNKIAKKCNFLVIHINAQTLYRLIHNQG
ncbi:hypothetical protein, partial [Aeromonas veronii]|uniref:hypothetical protein n=1 Tax=Aeromonas veronii TaxID=654 RepID=UPI003D21271B